MLYTIGYARLTPQSLAALAEKLEAIVTDCRAKPVSRWKPGFSRKELQKLLGPSYEWWGDRLGGWPPGAKEHSTTDAGIRELQHASKQENRLLLCAEEHPKDCHRHLLICGPHLPEAIHIFRDSTFTAEALNAAMAKGGVAADALPFTRLLGAAAGPEIAAAPEALRSAMFSARLERRRQFNRLAVLVAATLLTVGIALIAVLAVRAFNMLGAAEADRAPIIIEVLIALVVLVVLCLIAYAAVRAIGRFTSR